MGEQRKFEIVFVSDAGPAVQGAQAAAASFDKVTASVSKAADEAERYQAALQQMSARDNMAAGGGQAQDAELLKKRADLQQRLTERKKLAAEADSEIAAGVKKVSAAELEAAGFSVEGATKSLTNGYPLLFANTTQGSDGWLPLGDVTAPASSGMRATTVRVGTITVKTP